jgi:hypothetical protein
MRLPSNGALIRVLQSVVGVLTYILHGSVLTDILDK